MKEQSFEEFLMNQYFMDIYPPEEDAIEGFADWETDLDPNEWVDYAEKWNKSLNKGEL